MAVRLAALQGRERRGRPLNAYDMLRQNPRQRDPLLRVGEHRRGRRREEENRFLLPLDPLKETEHEEVENEGPGRQIVPWWIWYPDDWEPD
ncbi:hypothetical protein RADP37_05500 (plasmid) [Roseomonas mucosa]|uniref:Uncharacterized protein n=2 Tax=Roseomonas mucosa TaxID=207340 RepID=A0A4Y1MQY2_9PROT|nr:hypothetical protein RADP37_05500 [Roseomonas mucosa]